MGRLRRIKNDVELVNNSQYYFHNNFINHQPLYLEVGMGKGDFLIKHALTYPNRNYLGIDCYPTVLLKAIKKLDKLSDQLTNIKVCSINVLKILDLLRPNSVTKIFLNFSDPWPKKRHEKRRLPAPKFLDLYKQLLVKDGEIEFKTDNTGLYDYSLEILKSRKDIKILYYTNNLYAELKAENIIQTEYEKKFIGLNQPIKFIHFKFI